MLEIRERLDNQFEARSGSKIAVLDANQMEALVAQHADLHSLLHWMKQHPTQWAVVSGKPTSGVNRRLYGRA